jgi:branched-chain amino acid transport system substrate-binding protein
MSKKQIKRRTILGAGAGLAATAAFAPFGVRAQARDGIKIGYLQPLTGRLESYGKSHQQVFMLAVDEINAAGGVNGHPLQIVTEDTAFSPPQAIEKLRKVVEQDKAFLVVGPYGSNEMDPAAPLANRLKVPLISTTFTKIGIPAANRPWIFRFGPHDGQVIDYTVAAHRRIWPNAKKVVMIGNAGEAYIAATLKQTLPEAFKKNGFDLVDTVEVTTGQVDYSAAVTRMGKANADLIFVQVIAGELLGVAQEMAKQKTAEGKIVGGLQGLWAGPWLVVSKGAMEGWHCAGYLDYGSTNPKVKEFVAKATPAREKIGMRQPITVEASAYDLPYVLKNILTEAKITPATGLEEARTKIQQGFAAIKDYDGMSGKLTVDKDGETHGFAFNIFQGKGVQWVRVG